MPGAAGRSGNRPRATCGPGATRSPHVTTQPDSRWTAPILRELLAEGKGVQVQVTGWSMSPFIRSGDVITLQPLGGTVPRLGDVVAWGGPITGLRVHRVVGRASDGWRMRGDGASAPDEPMAAEEVLGRVVEIERGGRSLRLGLGPVRIGIALLSRFGLLVPLLRSYERLRQGSPG